MATFMSAAHLEIPTQPSGPVLELHGQRKVFTVPFGLKTLLEEMTLESLRHNPVNLYEFLANFLEDKLAAKEADDQLHGRGKHSWQWRRWSWDGSSLLTNEELVEFLSEYKITVEEAQHLATIIQAAYRGFVARKEYHHKQEEHEHHKEELWDEWRHEGNFFVSGKDVQDILSYYGITLFEANALATKIQKVFRGHLERERLALTNPELADHLKCLGISHQEANAHATRIQSMFRGYKVRKDLKGLVSPSKANMMEEVEEYDGEDADRQAWAKQQQEFLAAMKEDKKQPEETYVEEQQEEELEAFNEMDEESFKAHSDAAIKIQSGFRGMMARKKAKKLKAAKEMGTDEEEEGSETESEAPLPRPIPSKALLAQSQASKAQVSQSQAQISQSQAQIAQSQASRAQISQSQAQIAQASKAQILREASKMMTDEEASEMEGETGEGYASGGPRSQANARRTQSESQLQGPRPEPKEQQPKYDAYFPVGYEEADRVIGKDGVEIPPKFTHQHFGEIDPFEVKKKFSEAQFRDKMSFMLKDLKEVKNERMKQMGPTPSVSAVQANKKSAGQKQMTVQKSQAQANKPGGSNAEQAPMEEVFLNVEASPSQAGLNADAFPQSDVESGPGELPPPTESMVLHQSSEVGMSPPQSADEPLLGVSLSTSKMPTGSMTQIQEELPPNNLASKSQLQMGNLASKSQLQMPAADGALASKSQLQMGNLASKSQLQMPAADGALASKSQLQMPGNLASKSQLQMPARTSLTPAAGEGERRGSAKSRGGSLSKPSE